MVQTDKMPEDALYSAAQPATVGAAFAHVDYNGITAPPC